MKFILGKKIEMTQVWRGDELVPVTRVLAGPCLVAQVKNEIEDKYWAVQLAFGTKKEKRASGPEKGHAKKAGLDSSCRYLREFRLEDNDKGIKIEAGDKIDASTFNAGDVVKVTGTSKGKGFQGVVKRHHFSGSKKTHGNKDQERMTGSSGATGPQHVFKGTRKPGRMGGERVTVSNLEIVEVDKENNFLYIKGAVPGARNGLLLISGKGELKTARKSGRDDEAVEAEKTVGEAKPPDEEKKNEPRQEENIEQVVVEARAKTANMSE